MKNLKFTITNIAWSLDEEDEADLPETVEFTVIPGDSVIFHEISEGLGVKLEDIVDFEVDVRKGRYGLLNISNIVLADGSKMEDTEIELDSETLDYAVCFALENLQSFSVESYVIDSIETVA